MLGEKRNVSSEGTHISVILIPNFKNLKLFEARDFSVKSMKYFFNSKILNFFSKIYIIAILIFE